MVKNFSLQEMIQIRNAQSHCLLPDIHELSGEELNGNTK
ncbi:hypothetical protein SMITH_20 [Smithella sp. ME-1]|uniref:Uncharacterized protein n=1 Tax=hydrocarbon metagenome TaxID=938273 RepID=A0A0W8FMI9_9ZZZZ|nr:hypothetical protein SMITH_20 [Smithella sp. ME-1]